MIQIHLMEFQKIPKEKIFDICDAMRGLSVNAPVKIGDVILKNVCDTGVDIVASGNCDK